MDPRVNYRFYSNTTDHKNKNYNESEFYISYEDIIFILTKNNSEYKEGLTTLIGKIIILKEYTEIDLNQFSKNLDFLKINEINIFCIDDNPGVVVYDIKKPCSLRLITLGVEDFIKVLNSPEFNFLEFNKNSIYILRKSNHMDIKLLFNKINSHAVDIGRGGGQKSHVLSPIDFRLSSYLMAMFNFNYNYVCYLNIFNILDKSRYLPFINKKVKK